jgi:hypothetical protein
MPTPGGIEPRPGRLTAAKVDPDGMEECPHGGGPDQVAQFGELAVDTAVAQHGFLVARRRTSARRPVEMAGRPDRTFWMLQRWVTSWPC